MEIDYTKQYGSNQYFFWNDKPYKVIKEMRRKNMLTAMDLIEKKRVSFVWTDWRKHKRKAFTTGQVAKMLGRGKHIICRHIDRQKLPSPFTIEIPKRGNPPFSKVYIWSEKDVLNARAFFEELRKSYDLSEAEVRAMMNDEEIIYFIRDENGNFIPTWKAD